MTENSRQEILDKIRRNLATPPLPAVEEGISLSSEIHRSALRHEADRTLLQRFEEELSLVSGSAMKVTSPHELYTGLQKLCEQESYRKIVLSEEPLLRNLAVAEKLRSVMPNAEIWKASDVDLVQKLERADVGITGCELLAAETGTVILQSSPEAPRTLSLLPRAHVVIATADQLLPTLAACLDKLGASERGGLSSSCLTLITGPSRTADIEKVLVKGVHGPRELHVFLLSWG